MLASATVPRHLLRGATGFLALAGAILGAGILGPAALLLLAVTVVAWRGCPTCWAVGLIQTRERQRTSRVETAASRACTSCSLSR